MNDADSDRLEQTDTDRQEAIRDLCIRGHGLIAREKVLPALNCFQRAAALSHAPSEPLRAMIACCRLKLERYKEASSDFDAIGGHWGTMGAALALEGQGHPADECWERLSRTFPSLDRPITGGAALLALRISFLRMCRDRLEALRRSHGERPWGLHGLALIAEDEGRWAAARDLWQRCAQDFGGPRQAARRDRASAIEADGDAGSSAAYSRLLEEKWDHAQASQGSLRFDSVILVTYGRSGSTLLQGVLNSISGVLIRGENDNAFYQLFQFYRKLEASGETRKAKLSPRNPWYGINVIDLESVMDQLRALARTTLLADEIENRGVRCIGFKEIRYDVLGEQLSDYLDFLGRLLPNPAFVFNRRKLDDVVKSGWWSDEDPAAVRERLARFEQRADAYAESHDSCFRITYEDVVGQTARLKALFDFLGAVYDPARIRTVLATPHSYEPRQLHVQRLFRSL